MDHHLAVKEQLPEKYILGELSETERDDFEEHLADCSRCMDDVRTAQAFAVNSYAVFQEEAQSVAAGIPSQNTRSPGWKTRWAFAFSSGLNLALAGAALYAFVALVPFLKNQIRLLESPSVSEPFVLEGPTRSALPVFVVPRTASASFRLDLPQHFDAYVCIIKDAAGRTQKAYNLLAAGNTETLNLTVPVAGLHPGDYNVTLRGSQGVQSQLLVSFVLRVTAVH